MIKIKTLTIQDPEKIEVVMNQWIETEGDIEIHQIYPLPIAKLNQITKQQEIHLMIVVVYRKEGWK